jgi:hypothetical protein
MMVPVVADPPERSVLARKDTAKREHELELPARLEGAVCDQAVIAGRNAEHLERARHQENRHGRFADADNKHQAAPKVQQDYWQHKRDVAQGKPGHSTRGGIHAPVRAGRDAITRTLQSSIRNVPPTRNRLTGRRQ